VPRSLVLFFALWGVLAGFLCLFECSRGPAQFLSAPVALFGPPGLPVWAQFETFTFLLPLCLAGATSLAHAMSSFSQRLYLLSNYSFFSGLLLLFNIIAAHKYRSFAATSGCLGAMKFQDDSKSQIANRSSFYEGINSYI